MRLERQHGTTLIVGLILLTVVTLLALAGAGGANVERQLARNEQFRENAASAASAGLEYAISRIVSSPLPDSDAAPIRASAPLRDSTDRFETVTRFVGFESTLPQPAGANLAAAHFEITSTGYSAGGVLDRQRAGIMLVVPAPLPAVAPECTPAEGIPCFQRGELVRLSWQRVPSP
jgi:Tfp pilus assembly protein PilX